MRGVNFLTYKELETDNLMEIDSVSSFISQIKTLRESDDGRSTEFYFRGQEVEFWDIEPSVFRNGMLSIEHKLMQIPLQKIPTEFKDLHTKFDIMTKYQHYGMCTRLLDLTTNPLVALYFACKRHGEEFYIKGDDKEAHEPYGVIYFTRNYYPSLPTDIEVQIVSSLANYDLSKENTVVDVLKHLMKEHIIDEKTMQTWLQEDNFSDFIKIVQSNYMVTPTYTNERLRKQSGVFLLASLFSVSDGVNVEKSVIAKSRGNLRDEFEKEIFFIRGENKEEILRELDLYNINEATLFPELEHQLNYIKYVNSGKVQAVSDFEKYELLEKSNKVPQIIDNNALNKYVVDNLTSILSDVVLSDEIDELKEIIQSSLSIDWYKRERIMSKIRRSISEFYLKNDKNKKVAQEKAKQITESLEEAVRNYMKTSGESGE